MMVQRVWAHLVGFRRDPDALMPASTLIGFLRRALSATPLPPPRQAPQAHTATPRETPAMSEAADADRWAAPRGIADTLAAESAAASGETPSAANGARDHEA